MRIRALNLRTYLMTFQEEHRAIVAAIDSGSVERARAAMHAHLVSSIERYKALAPDRAANGRGELAAKQGFNTDLVD